MAKYSFEADLFYGEAGATASSKLDIYKDITVNDEMTEIDVTMRRSNGVKNSEPGIRSVSLEFELVYMPNDAGYKAVRDAYLNRKPIALFATDGDGGGIDVDCKIFQFPVARPLDGVLTVSVVAKPCISERDLADTEPTGGAGK